MIDIHTEQVISLTEAAKRLPSGRGKRLHPSTLHRWAMRGCGGTKLEAIVIGGRRCTSLEALHRFIERRTAASQPDSDARAAPRSPVAYRSHKEDDEYLRQHGL